MKPSPFSYHAPSSTAQALEVLAEVGEDGKVLAGGQSLIPILNMRLAAPAHLVDVNGLADELGYVRVSDDAVEVGALARHAEVERHPAAGRALPLLGQALRNVAHPVVRNRGTVVGSLAHADPSGEMTAVLALLGGSVELASSSGRRTVDAGDFFIGPLESAVAPGELAVSARFPLSPPCTGTEVAEVARRHGDYAVCGVVAAVTLDEENRVARARAAYLSMSDTPVVLELTEPVAGAAADAAEWGAAGEIAREQLHPESDIHASAEYRRELAGVLTARALRTAAARATSNGHGEGRGGE